MWKTGQKCPILRVMITQYIQAAMRKAKYEILEGNEGYYGEIPGFQGVWANAPTLEGCRDDLADALETWLLFRISRGMKIPTVGKHKFSVEFAAWNPKFGIIPLAIAQY